MITQLIDNQYEDLPFVGFVFNIFRQDRAETTVVIVPLSMRENESDILDEHKFEIV